MGTDTVRLQITLGLVLILGTMALILYNGINDLAYRMDAETQAQLARSIENGAKLYETRCAHCHGVYGEGRIGPTLNTPALFDPGPNGRLARTDWTGTLESFLFATISAGRPRTIMQPWSQRFGGPLRDDEIQDLVNFILNWRETAGEFPVGAVVEATPIPPEQLVVVGRELFYNVDYLGCGSCHTIAGLSNGKVGPDLTHIGTVAEERAKEAGLASAEEYIRQSIVDPDAFIAPDCPSGPCPEGVMPTAFGKILTPDRIDALVTFLMRLK